MSIENAAREIAKAEFEEMREGLDEACIAEIIRRHLFPVVKPEEVIPLTWYWVRNDCAVWTIRRSDNDGKRFNGWKWDEIRGPVPMPE